jgi:cell shape-determining protein MreC
MDLIENAREELKRADHLIYVSLKYTRTCDIIMNTIKRMIESYNFVIQALLEQLKDKKKIPSVPGSNTERAELLAEKDKKYKKYMKEYFLLRKIEGCRFEGREEYRKHVTMIVHMDNKVLEVSVPVLEEYFNKVKEFTNLAEDDLT